ncbi:hypothetical protein H4R35_001979 [Dimargaris xerosporica]|nr:hypothetical protein H4R35_001979 [Dimargaris xerosporica]
MLNNLPALRVTPTTGSTDGQHPPINVVIIGGSTAGIKTAQSLVKAYTSQQVRVTVIDKLDHHYHRIGAARALVDSEFAQQLWIPFTNLFHCALLDSTGGHTHQFVQGCVTRVEEGAVYLEEQDRIIPYDYLVVATGSTLAPSVTPEPPNKVDYLLNLGYSRKGIAHAQHILIIGGGPVGVEAAGEIKHAFPDKEVTMVHRTTELLGSPLPLRFRQQVTQRILDLGVEVILEDSVDLMDESNLLSAYNLHQMIPNQTLRTFRGKTIRTDWVLQTDGARINTDFLCTLQTDGLNSLVGPNQRVRVLPTLQVKDPKYPNIYAVGDVNDLKCIKTATNALLQTDILLRNLKTCIRAKMDERQGKAPKRQVKLASFRDKNDTMYLALGPQKGICLLPMGFIAGDWAARFLKSRDLALTGKWRQMGLEMPHAPSSPSSSMT